MEGVREQARIEGGQHQELLAPGPFKDQGAREPVTREILIPWSVTLDLRSGSLDPVWFVFLINLFIFVIFEIKSVGFMAFLRLDFFLKKKTLSLWHS